MRLFVALDIDDTIRSGIVRLLDGVRNFAPEARWVRPESLHVTLKFIGEKSEEDIGRIIQHLKGISAEPIELQFHGYGFFPGARAPRIFWIGCEGGAKLTSLAATVDDRLAQLGLPKEEHAFNAHLTLARSGGSGHRRHQSGDGHGLQRLQEKLAALPAPDFGTITAREFFLYRSQPGPGGSKYTKLERFSLRSRDSV